MSFVDLGLSEEVIQGVYASGHSIPTAIQKQTIPVVMQGRDVLGCAPTGTGKTAAFVLPILSRLSCFKGQKRHNRDIKVLVLTPTRELAQQIEDAFKSYGSYMNLRTLSIYGGVSTHNQLKELRIGVDVVIATPGRLLDHMQRRSADLSRVEILVVDEADRMYDMGFINDMKKIVAQVPVKRQTLLFSATMSDQIRKLVSGIQKNPALIDIGERRSPAETVTQMFYSIPKQHKFNLLVHILKKEAIETMLIFSRTKHGADKIKKRLDKCGIVSEALHADRSQGQRLRALDGFKRRKFKVLVATDIAARGIDVTGISHVLNFDLPAFAPDYIHRIGRTGRAELSGTALSFVSDEEVKCLSNIRKHTGQRFTLSQYNGFTPAQTNAPDVRIFKRSRQGSPAFAGA